MDDDLKDLELYAWVGEDEMGSGEIGLKQGMVPAGCIPLVTVKREKNQQPYIVEQMRLQAARFGKNIRLARFTFAGVVQQANPEDKQ
jgi:hypothetical protein